MCPESDRWTIEALRESLKQLPDRDRKPLEAFLSDPGRKIEVVYGYLLGFQPNTVIAVQRDGVFYLPGGVLEGPGAPDGTKGQSHFSSLSWYVNVQTGLDLLGISDPIAVAIFEGELGASVSLLFVGKASGERTGGISVDIQNIPEFDLSCQVDEEDIRTFATGRKRRLLRLLQALGRLARRS